MLPLKNNKNDNGNIKEINQVEKLKILYNNHNISNFIINSEIPKEKNGNLDIIWLILYKRKTTSIKVLNTKKIKLLKIKNPGQILI
jgi:hypothetical protein